MDLLEDSPPDSGIIFPEPQNLIPAIVSSVSGTASERPTVMNITVNYYYGSQTTITAAGESNQMVNVKGAQSLVVPKQDDILMALDVLYQEAKAVNDRNINDIIHSLDNLVTEIKSNNKNGIYKIGGELMKHSSDLASIGSFILQLMSFAGSLPK